jgi:hypothetical protein
VRFLKRDPAIVHLPLKGVELTLLKAAPDAEDHPPARELIEHGELLGDADRVLEADDDDARGDLQPFRSRRDRRAEHGNRRNVAAVVEEVMLGEPHRLHAHQLGFVHLCEKAVVEAAHAAVDLFDVARQIE